MKNRDDIEIKYEEEMHNFGLITPSFTLILNGERIKGSFDAFAFMHSTLTKKRDIELMTCSCGVSGCAGIFYGTTVKVRRHTVEWRDIDCKFPKRFYSFDRATYELLTVWVRIVFGEIGLKASEGYFGDWGYDYPLHYFQTEADFNHAVVRDKAWILNKEVVW
jgi:hypothetical protein